MIKRISIAFNENELEALVEEAIKYKESVYCLMKRKILSDLKIKPVKKGRPAKKEINQ